MLTAATAKRGSIDDQCFIFLGVPSFRKTEINTERLGSSITQVEITDFELREPGNQTFCLTSSSSHLKLEVASTPDISSLFLEQDGSRKRATFEINERRLKQEM